MPGSGSFDRFMATLSSIDAEPRPLNEPLIRKVVEYIETNPDEWDQGGWGVSKFTIPKDYFSLSSSTRPTLQLSETWRKCNTKACFAGTALHLANAETNENDEVPVAAAKLLGLSAEQAYAIFYWMDDETQDSAERVAELKERVSRVTGLKFDDFE